MDSSDNNSFKLNRLLPPPAFFFIAACVLLFLSIFFIGRFSFWFSFGDDTSASAIELITSFLIGIRFDLVVSLIALLPLLLILPFVRLGNRIVRFFTISYLTTTLGTAIILTLADLRYYSYLANHLDFRVIEYFNQGTTFWHLIKSDNQMYLFLGLWLLSLAVLSLIVRKIYLKISAGEKSTTLTKRIIFFILFFALFALGIRGRLGTSSIDWSVAYIGNDHFVNQLGLNPLYTLARAWLEEGHDPRLSYLDESNRFPFIPRAEAIDSMRAMFGTDRDVWHDDDSTMYRLTRQPKSGLEYQPNIVIVLMESWSGRNTGVLGSEDNLTPRFDSLSSNGILFTDIYTSGTRTSYGIAATLFSFPSAPGRSIMTRYNALHQYVSLSEILHERGYHNSFVYGGDLVFDNMEGFLRTRRFDLILGECELKSDKFTEWGIPDHLMFDELLTIIDSLPRPFLNVVLTLSNHEPFDLPDSSLQKYPNDDETSLEYNAQIYADHALGQFMEHMAHKPVHDSTIYLFISDHCKWSRARFHASPINFRIPLLIYAPKIIGDSGLRIDKVGSQTDLIPTLMGILGDDYQHSSFGRDLLRLPDNDFGFAFTNVFDWIAGISKEGYYYEQIGRQSHLLLRNEILDTIIDRQSQEPVLFELLKRRTRTFMQVVDQLSTPPPPE